MSSGRCVAYSQPTNACDSDQNMARHRITAPSGLILGHEVTNETTEVGGGIE